jgi:hypothetical protein
MTYENNNNDINLLNEIFLTPSSDIKTDRFSDTADAAPCNGSCSSGQCRMIA